MLICFFFKQMTAYEMRISDWSSDVCSSDKDGIAVGGRDLGQGRAPCTRADYANSHAFTPAPRAFSAPGSSGQRGRAATSSPSVNPAANRSAPAQPIMAALSVHSQSGGATKGRRSEEHTSELQSLM